MRLFLTVSSILVVVFAIRLVDFQILRAEAIQEYSYENRAVTRTIPAVRGDILDANGTVLATTVYRYDINAAPAIVRPVEKVVDGVTQIVSVETIAADLARLLQEDISVILPKLSGTSNYVNLKKRVDADTHRSIMELGVPWIFSDAYQNRLYPNGAVAGNLLGFVDPDGNALAGIERQFNACLAGVDGQERYESGVDGIRIPASAVITQEVKPGRDIVLTIDASLQYQAQQILAEEVERLGAEWASAVVIEVKTGRIVLAADAPSVDSNDPAKSDPKDRGARVFQFAYEPGSTMKSLTAATAIEAGFASMSTGVVAPDKIALFDRTISDVLPHETWNLTLAGVLTRSSNVGMIKIAEDIPASTRYDFMKLFGFGKPTEVGFEGETSGLLTDYRNWDGITNFTTTFGQGLSVSPIQMASVYQTLANGGVRLNPVLVAGCFDENGEVSSLPKSTSTQVVSAKTAQDVVLMLEKVVEDIGIGQATAVAGYRSAGKTGTAQISEGDGYGDYFATSFFGMAPVEDPQYAMGVIVYKPTKVHTNSMAAASGYQQILSKVLLSNRVSPSTTVSSEIPTEWE
jgi:cell division protein FtsI (penicillin-binding protein 3)